MLRRRGHGGRPPGSDEGGPSTDAVGLLNLAHVREPGFTRAIRTSPAGRVPPLRSRHHTPDACEPLTLQLLERQCRATRCSRVALRSRYSVADGPASSGVQFQNNPRRKRHIMTVHARQALVPALALAVSLLVLAPAAVANGGHDHADRSDKAAEAGHDHGSADHGHPHRADFAAGRPGEPGEVDARSGSPRRTSISARSGSRSMPAKPSVS